MYNFKITWVGSITDTKFTEEIEAETVVQALNEFYTTYKHEVNIIKIKRCEIKDDDYDTRLGIWIGVVLTVFVEFVILLMLGSFVII